MSKNHEKWKCSCGAENYFRHRKCRECSEPMPQSAYSAVFRSELRLITQSISDQIRTAHNGFWQKLKLPLGRGVIAVRVISFILMAIFAVTLFQNSKDIRLDDIADKAQLKAECIVDKAPALVPDVEWQRVWVDISSKFKDWRGISHITEKFDDVEDIFNEKIKEIESKKDTVLDYVNR